MALLGLGGGGRLLFGSGGCAGAGSGPWAGAPFPLVVVGGGGWAGSAFFPSLSFCSPPGGWGGGGFWVSSRLAAPPLPPRGPGWVCPRFSALFLGVSRGSFVLFFFWWCCQLLGCVPVLWRVRRFRFFSRLLLRCVPVPRCLLLPRSLFLVRRGGALLRCAGLCSPFALSRCLRFRHPRWLFVVRVGGAGCCVARFPCRHRRFCPRLQLLLGCGGGPWLVSSLSPACSPSLLSARVGCARCSSAPAGLVQPWCWWLLLLPLLLLAPSLAVGPCASVSLWSSGVQRVVGGLCPCPSPSPLSVARPALAGSFAGLAGCAGLSALWVQRGWWWGGGWPVASLVGFSGSRSLPASFAPVVASAVAAASPRRVAVGCCRGADQFVHSAAPSASVFRASAFSGPPAAALVQRSVALVRAVVASGQGAAFVGLVISHCPPAVVPSPLPSACFCGSGSGSWATLALAAGLGLPVSVFWCALGPPSLPAAWGSWSPCSAFPGAWSLSPAAPRLF